MEKKATPGKLAKHGQINMLDLSRRTGYSRQWLLQLFNKNRESFEALLITEMEKDLLLEIEREIAAIRTAEQIKKDLTNQFKKRVEDIKGME